MILMNFDGHNFKIDEMKAENDISFILPQISTTIEYPLNVWPPMYIQNRSTQVLNLTFIYML